MTAVQHHDQDELAAFAAGRSTAAAIGDIETHLKTCGDCRATLETLPPDSLEELLRDSLETGSDTQCASGELEPTLFRDHPRYRVFGVLGAGGMGTVYRAEHRLMRRRVALKVIGPKLLLRSGSIARFQREVETVAKLDHPNIATAFDAERIGDTLVLVSELIDGRDLARIVRENGPMSVGAACDIIRQAAAGLHHAHGRGIVHRDVKPSNLMLASNGIVKVIDFGPAGLGEAESEVARPMDETRPGESLTDCGQGFGTPEFVAPE